MWLYFDIQMEKKMLANSTMAYDSSFAFSTSCVDFILSRKTEELRSRSVIPIVLCQSPRSTDCYEKQMRLLKWSWGRIRTTASADDLLLFPWNNALYNFTTREGLSNSPHSHDITIKIKWGEILWTSCKNDQPESCICT